MDATHRSELRELNELNYARFDAKLEQRIAELRAEFNSRIAELRADMHAGFAKLDAKFENRFLGMDTKLAQLETRLTKRMFGFWIAQAATTAGLLFGVVKLLH